MNTSSDNKSLIELMKEARKGTVVLPQFQRNFVWSRDDITNLLTSILEGYFIGSFLLLRTDENSIPFAMRTLEGITLRENELKPTFMILDGQQRLTSLHYAFFAPKINLKQTKYPYKFFLDLKKVAEEQLSEAIWSERADLVNEWSDQKKQFAELQIPFTDIDQWDDWRFKYEDWCKDQENGMEAIYRNQYRTPWHEIIAKRLSDVTVPTLVIDKISPDNQDEIARVCAIFEKMNSTGVALSVYDLLTARLYRHKIDIHKLWETVIAEHPLLNQYSGGEPDAYGVYLLRVIALLRGLDVKSKTIINLSHKEFEADWKTAAKYMEESLKRITSNAADGFGVINPKWLPYTTMISPMAALLAQIHKHKADHNAYKALRKWYWSSALMERYAGSVESTIYRDYQDLLKIVLNKPVEPGVFADADKNILNNPNFSIRGESRVNAIYRAVMCLIALRGAKDFRADDSIEFHTLDDHHIFPDNYLRKQMQQGGATYSADARNNIVNRTLISTPTNQSIKDKAPSMYLDQFVPSMRIREIMGSHFINDNAIQAMRDNNFEAFLDAREKALIDEIRKQLTMS